MAELEDPYDDGPKFIGGIERPPRLEDEVTRDGKGRPYIREINILGDLTGKNVTYTRVTTYIDCVDDKSALSRWSERQLVKGLLGPRGARFRAEASASLTDDRKHMLNKVIKEAKVAAGASDQAAIGSAVHTLSERYDLGLELGYIDDLYRPDLDAYIEATRFLRHIHIERIMVNDELGTAGTPDRIVEYLPCEVCGKTLFIFDLKTGRVDGYTQNQQSMQLAIYAHSKLYVPSTGERLSPGDLCLHKAIICALPAATGRAELQWIDIATGWELVSVATSVREARKIKAARVPFVATPNISNLIHEAKNLTEIVALRRIYSEFWTERDTEIADVRIGQFEAGS